MKNKLISMVEFVFETYDQIECPYDSEHLMFKYAKFLSKPLTLGMFVPCDEDGNVLAIHKGEVVDESYPKEYQQAQERVIFEGFEFQKAEKYGSYDLIRFPNKKITPLYPKLWGGMTIEDLIPYNLTLTASALNQLK